ADTELREHLVQVVLDGARADEQQSGYLRVRAPLGREPGDLRLLRGELVDRLDGTFAHRLAGGRKLALSALGERSRAHSAEQLVGRAQLLARVDAAVLTTQPLAVAQQPPAARFDPERPFGAARPRAFAQAVERRDGFVGLPAADAGLDELDQGPSVKYDVLVLAGLPGGRQCLGVLAVAVVQQRGKPEASAKRRTLASLGRVVHTPFEQYQRLIAARRG